MPRRLQQYPPVHNDVGVRTIGDGIIERTDGVVVALIELTPPDFRLYDDTRVAQILDAYATVLRTITARCMLYTFAVQPNMQATIHALITARDAAPDMTSFSVLHAWQSYLSNEFARVKAMPTVRWIMALPSEHPEPMPRGTWGELYPSYLAGSVDKVRGDGRQTVTTLATRVISALGTLGLDPPPRLLDQAAIIEILRYGLDPVTAVAQPQVIPIDQIRPIQTTEETQ